jgi:hypothetical protein
MLAVLTGMLLLAAAPTSGLQAGARAHTATTWTSAASMSTARYVRTATSLPNSEAERAWWRS